MCAVSNSCEFGLLQSVLRRSHHRGEFRVLVHAGREYTLDSCNAHGLGPKPINGLPIDVLSLHNRSTMGVLG
jgi:hypothetical protein